MQNMETWNFANRYCGRLWWKLGWILLVPTILVQIPFDRSDINAIGILGGGIVSVQLVVMLLTIIPTEQALKKTFYEDGTHR